MTPRPTASRNLILVHTEGWQGIGDFQAIKSLIEESAPDIEVFIASNTRYSSLTRKAAARRPSLIFSPVQLLTFRPQRGKVYAGRPMSKLIEMQRLVDAGLPVPRFQELRPETILSDQDWGPLIVVKPSHELASWGNGIELIRTPDVRYRAPTQFPAGHPGRLAPMVAQTFIDCGSAMSCRVLTLFGTPLFTYLRQSQIPLALAARQGPYQTNDFMPATEHSTASLARDPDILALAAKAYQAMPEIPLQGCDILRDKNGALHILEVNPGGGTWVFSNAQTEGYKARLGIADLTAPFDAFRACARLLIERTRTEAV